MKKILIVALVAFSLHSFAQKGLHLGVMGGPQFTAQLNKQDSDDPNVRFEGITMRSAFGIIANYHFTDKVGVGTQFLFSYQGMKYENLAGVEFFRKVNYLKLPILLHVNSSPDKVVGGYFYIGPQFSFQIGNDAEINGVSQKGTLFYPVYDDIHKGVTIGAAMGFGMLFNAMDGKLQPHFGLRLDGDFTSVYDDEKATIVLSSYGANSRGATRNVNGLIEFGIKYVLFN